FRNYDSLKWEAASSTLRCRQNIGGRKMNNNEELNRATGERTVEKLEFRMGPFGAAVPLLFFVVWAITISVMQLSSEVARSEEHTSELQSRFELVCRLLPDTKKNRTGT